MTLQNRVSPIVICWFLACLIAFSGLIGAASAQNPVPLINEPLVPDAISPGILGFTLTVDGRASSWGARVTWNGRPLATTFVTDSQLSASVAAVDIANAGTASEMVVLQQFAR